MKSEEKQTKNLTDNTSSNRIFEKNISDYMESIEVERFQGHNQLQTNHAISSENKKGNKKDPRLVAFTVLSGASFLFLVALYFGIINP
jgi:hypothetical protein